MQGYDWQTLVAIGCVLLAAGWAVFRALRLSSKGSCGAGCGHCASNHASKPDVVISLEDLRADNHHETETSKSLRHH